jgi:hypothetical protein
LYVHQKEFNIINIFLLLAVGFHQRWIDVEKVSEDASMSNQITKEYDAIESAVVKEWKDESDLKLLYMT